MINRKVLVLFFVILVCTSVCDTAANPLRRLGRRVRETVERVERDVSDETDSVLHRPRQVLDRIEDAERQVEQRTEEVLDLPRDLMGDDQGGAGEEVSDTTGAALRLFLDFVQHGAQDIPLEDELLFGEAIMALMVHSYGGRLLDPNAYHALWDYVNTIAQALAPVTIRPDLPTWRVGIVENSELGACAGPGGYILITTGLLEFLNDEAELAGVIAHEMAHISRRHGLHTIISSRRREMWFNLGQSLIGSQRFAAGVRMVRSSFLDAIRFSYARDRELEADKLAAEWLYRTGYDPRAFRDVISRLPQAESRVYRSHPSNERRVAALDDYIAGLKGVEHLPRVEHRYVSTVFGGHEHDYHD